METGTKISIAGHVLLILLVTFSSTFSKRDSKDPLNVTEVTLISGEEFASLTQKKSTVPVSPPVEVLPKPVVKPIASEPEKDKPLDDVQKDELGQISDIEQLGEISKKEAVVTPPKVSDRISSEINEKLTEKIKPLKEAPVLLPEKIEKVKKKPKKPAQLEESSTRIVTEAEKVKEKSLAPVKSILPKNRPVRIIENTLKEKASVSTEETSRQENSDMVAAMIAAAVDEDIKTQSNDTNAGSKNGNVLTGAESSGLMLAIKQCWNVPFGLENAENLKVTLRIKLNKDGSLLASPVLISPKGEMSRLVEIAYMAAKRAVHRCVPYTGLPLEKYDSWKSFDVTFNPKKMVLR